jgi:nitrogen fixation protein NifB
VNSHEQRPGVTAHTLSPELALAAVRRAMAAQTPGCAINVVGIAGPGDALASDAALQAFRLVRREFPQLIRCMSTNGLLLPQKAAELVEAGVETLTVTVNDVNSERLARINDYVVYEGRRLAGREAAELLIAQQLEGIRRVSAAGVLVKVNTVLVPSVNGGHIGEIARTVAEAGASLYNIIPLIPQHKMAGEAAPTCDELEDARLEAEGFIEVFRHCQHCRADAIGIPGGTDISGRVYAGMFDEASELATMATFSHG